MSSASNKRRRTAAGAVSGGGSASVASGSERLELAQRLAALQAGKDAFLRGVAALEAYDDETLRALDMRIDEKKTQLAELDVEFANAKKQSEIRATDELAEFKRAAAVRFLEASGEEPIGTAELEQLRADVRTLRETRESAVEAAVTQAKADGERALRAALSSCELKHKAESAELVATAKQQQNAIEALQAQIVALRQECDKQRELTKQVAEAGKQGAISQTFGRQ